MACVKTAWKMVVFNSKKAFCAEKNETEFQYLNIAFKMTEHVEYIT